MVHGRSNSTETLIQRTEAAADGRLLLRPEKTADILDLSRAKIFLMLASGELPSIKIGRSRRVPVDALKAWIVDQMIEQAA